ncbi:hypothetical protein ACVDG8_034545 [Mesorhizobium sp. ORM8.1]
MGKRGISNVGALPLRSKPECLTLVQLKERRGRILKHRILKSLNSISVSNGHQHGRRTLNLVGQVLDPIKALCQPIVQQIKLGGSMEIGALFAVHVQGGKHHRHGLDSSIRAWPCDLQESPAGCFRSRLPGAYAAAQGKADRQPVVVAEHCFGLHEGKFGALRALPGDRHFQVQKFNHSESSFVSAVPSIRKPSPKPFVPKTPQTSWTVP